MLVSPAFLSSHACFTKHGGYNALMGAGKTETWIWHCCGIGDRTSHFEWCDVSYSPTLTDFLTLFLFSHEELSMGQGFPNAGFTGGNCHRQMSSYRLQPSAPLSTAARSPTTPIIRPLKFLR